MRAKDENRIGKRDREGESEDRKEKRGKRMKRDRKIVSSLFLALSKSSAFTLHSLFYSPPRCFPPSPLSSPSLSLINIRIFFILNLFETEMRI